MQRTKLFVVINKLQLNIMKTKDVTLIFNSTKTWKYQNICQLTLSSWHNVVSCLFCENYMKIKHTPEKSCWSARTSGWELSLVQQLLLHVIDDWTNVMCQPDCCINVLALCRRRQIQILEWPHASLVNPICIPDIHMPNRKYKYNQFHHLCH